MVLVPQDALGARRRRDDLDTNRKFDVGDARLVLVRLKMVKHVCVKKLPTKVSPLKCQTGCIIILRSRLSESSSAESGLRVKEDS